MTSAASARGVRACGSATANGSRRVLAGGPIRVGQQAQRAVALPAEQPPASIPSSLLEGTNLGSELEFRGETPPFPERGTVRLAGACSISANPDRPCGWNSQALGSETAPTPAYALTSRSTPTMLTTDAAAMAFKRQRSVNRAGSE